MRDMITNHWYGNFYNELLIFWTFHNKYIGSSPQSLPSSVQEVKPACTAQWSHLRVSGLFEFHMFHSKLDRCMSLLTFSDHLCIYWYQYKIMKIYVSWVLVGQSTSYKYTRVCISISFLSNWRHKTHKRVSNVHWSIAPKVHWTIGPLVPLVHWSIGPLFHCSIGPQDHRTRVVKSKSLLRGKSLKV